MILTYLRRVVLGEEWGVLSWAIRTFMLPLALAYAVGLKIYLAAYALGFRKRCRLPVPVISVGNLTFGGTGKTPAAIAICRMLVTTGKRVVVLSRGVGGRARGSLIVSDGQNILCDVKDSGDEPILLARALLGVPVLVDKDRRRSGALACERFGPDIVVLDDGMQYWQLHRDLDVVVVSARRPFGSGFLMPAGDLREPPTGLARAGLVFLVGAHELSDIEQRRLESKIDSLTHGAPIVRCRRSPVRLRTPNQADIVSLDWLRGRRVVAFCGIGTPSSFTDLLESTGARVLEHLVFPDHHVYSERDLQQITAAKKNRGAEAVITTEKDVARLFGTPSVSDTNRAVLEDLYVLEIELEIEEPDRVAQYIANRVERAYSSADSEETCN